MTLTKSTIKNLQRIETLINQSLVKCSCCNLPIPALIEISPIDFCNRKCVFCPKSKDLIAPNQKHLYMNLELASIISRDLSAINFKGTIILAGYGEPLTSPNIMQLIQIFASKFKVEMVTNGDLLTVENIKQMNDYNLSYLSVSVYGGLKQMKYFKSLFESANIPPTKYTLRDRWYKSNKDFGIKLTNRAGLINIGNQPKINLKSKCFYPFYSMMVDWNGDVLLCPQDWNRRIKFGNLNYQTIHDIWVSKPYIKYRRILYNDRTVTPCNGCNCEGTYHGKTHATYFMKEYNEK